MLIADLCGAYTSQRKTGVGSM